MQRLEGIEALQGPRGSRGLERCVGPAFRVLVLRPQAGRATGVWQTCVGLGLRRVTWVCRGPGPLGGVPVVQVAGEAGWTWTGNGRERRPGNPFIIHSSTFAGVSWWPGPVPGSQHAHTRGSAQSGVLAQEAHP